MKVSFKPSFLRTLKKFPPRLIDEVEEKIELFKNPKNHAQLRVHKLHGELKDYYSFSVNYEYRIIFQWETKNESAVLLGIGDHSVYD